MYENDTINYVPDIYFGLTIVVCRVSEPLHYTYRKGRQTPTRFDSWNILLLGRV